MINATMQQASSATLICLDIPYLSGEDSRQPPPRSAHLLYTHYHFAFTSAQSISLLFLIQASSTYSLGGLALKLLRIPHITVTDTSGPWADLVCFCAGCSYPRLAKHEGGLTGRDCLETLETDVVVWKGKCRLTSESDSNFFCIAHLYGASLSWLRC